MTNSYNRLYANMYNRISKKILNAHNKQKKLSEAKTQKQMNKLRTEIRNLRKKYQVNNSQNIMNKNIKKTVNAYISKRLQNLKNEERRGGWGGYMSGGYNSSINARNAWNRLSNNTRNNLISRNRVIN